MNYIYLGLFLAAFLLIEVLIGGTRLLFSLPSYSILGAAALLTLFSLRRRRAPADWLCLLVTVLFSGYALVRILNAPVVYLARTDLFIVLGALIVYGLFAFHLTHPRYRLAALLVFLVLASAHTFVGVIQFAEHRNFMPISWLQRTDYGQRASGFYICPNHLAGYLEVVAVMGLSAVFWSRWKLWVKIIAGYLSCVAVFGQILTGSRGGYLSLMAGLAVFGVMSLLVLKRRLGNQFWKAGLAALALLLLAAGGVSYMIANSQLVQTRVGSIADTGNVRLDMWQAALDQFQVAPLLGTGSATYRYYGRLFRTPRVAADPIYAHNDYLQFLAEFGIVGAALFLVFLGVHLWRGTRVFQWFVNERLAALRRLRSDGLALNIGAISAIATYLVHSIFDFNLHIPANALLLAFVFAILANPGVAAAMRPESEKSASYAAWALPVLGIWVLIVGVPKLQAEYFAEKARVALRDGLYAESAANARKALETEKENPNLYYYLGESEYELAMMSEAPPERASGLAVAVESYQRGVELFPMDTWLLLPLGLALDELGRFPEAEPHFRKVLEWDPNWAQNHAHYGWHLIRSGRGAEARPYFEKSLELRHNLFAEAGLEQLRKDGLLVEKRSEATSD